MNNHYNCIYMYINKVNNHKYIGQTNDFNRRYKEHLSYSKNKNKKDYNSPIHKAIRKYGINNFEIIILKEDLSSQCLLNLYECYYIKKYNCLSKENYNVASGGGNGNPYAGKTEEDMKEIRKKMSENHADFKGENHPQYGKHLNKGINNPMYGKKQTKETREKISIANKGRNGGENNPMYGKTGINSPNSKKVMQYDKEYNLIKIWDSTMDAQRELNIKSYNISKCCNGKTKSAGGFIWKYIE